MRKSTDRTSRVIAGAAQIDAALEAGSWIPATSTAHVVLDPRHWSDRHRQRAQWRLIEALNRLRTLH